MAQSSTSRDAIFIQKDNKRYVVGGWLGSRRGHNKRYVFCFFFPNSSLLLRVLAVEFKRIKEGKKTHWG